MYLAMNKWHPSHLCCPVCGCNHIFSLDEDGSASQAGCGKTLKVSFDYVYT
jgi:hypothetical protein